MKITSNRNIATSKRPQQKKNTQADFGRLFSSELQSASQPTSQQNDAEKEPQKQNILPLVEKASKLLSQALSQLEIDAQPNQDTLHAIHDIRQELDLLTTQGNESVSLTQAKTLLAVEAQRIQAMKH